MLGQSTTHHSQRDILNNILVNSALEAELEAHAKLVQCNRPFSGRR